MISLNDGIDSLRGIGKVKVQNYARLGISTVKDLLYFFPAGYQDRSEEKHIHSIQPGEVVLVKGTVINAQKTPYFRNKTRLFKLKISDGFQEMEIVYFNANYLDKSFKIGEEYYFYGKIGKSGYKKQMIHPEFSKEKQGIVPIYSMTKGISQNEIRKRVSDVLFLADEIEEYLPDFVLKRYDLPEISYALKHIHKPESVEALNLAKKRIIYEELFFLETGFYMMKNISGQGQSHMGEVDAFVNSLPYDLTDAQKRVVSEIGRDMESDFAMSRLLQGDVGSGKTVVAETAMYKAVISGSQSVFMAPTDVLVRQHFKNFKRDFKSHNISVECLSGGMNVKERTEILQKLRSGKIDILVGTHALLQDDVEFFNLGLVVTDEQHRFGVSQRRVLNEKGASPDVLIMTATPIPRTLSMVLYGDTDISIIDSLPPGRKEIITLCVLKKAEHKIYNIVKEELHKGRQAYVVAPLIEKSELIDAKSAVELYDELKVEFKEFSIGLLHGNMSREEKESVMLKFSEGKIRLLVSTVVIEVGIDVPNASVMVIENCERFGLAQMHQLRGRVGRGSEQSYCFLILGSDSKLALERAGVMRESNDGFYISERDLDLRGPGDVLGTRQHGIQDSHLTAMVSHMDVMEELRDAVAEMLREDKDLSLPENRILKERVTSIFGEKISMDL